MTAFVWQTLLLLSLAYVLGCWIACLARRMIGTSTRKASPVDAVPAGHEVMPHLMDEDDHRQHQNEGGNGVKDRQAEEGQF